MEFGEQIKLVRTSRNLTQEQFAGKLNVTRQAVSNWENNRNLPDIEMLIQISAEFHVSLDQLILGGTDMNKMTEKLIRDGSETRKAKNEYDFHDHRSGFDADWLEIPEIQKVADRCIVFYHGGIQAELPREEITEEQVMLCATNAIHAAEVLERHG
jgi:transcriptional regulator with XRE-family HTH domain